MTFAGTVDRLRRVQYRRSGGVACLAIIAGYLALFISSPAHADPCNGTLPQSGARYTGVVRHVIDGDGLCIGPADQPDRWIEIRLADFYAPELRETGGAAARQRLARLTRGRSIACIARNRSYDRIVAACMLDGRPIGRLLRERGAREGGRGFRR